MIYTRVLEPSSKSSSFRAAKISLNHQHMNFMMYIALFPFLHQKWILFNRKFIKTVFLETEMIGSFIMTVQTTTLKLNRKMETRNMGSKGASSQPDYPNGTFHRWRRNPSSIFSFPGNQNEQKSLKPLKTKISSTIRL